jgi:hypothetical protein
VVTANATLALRHHNVFIRKSPSGLFEEVDVTSGDPAEFIRFRDGQGEAVLDLHKVKLPTIKIVPGLKFQGSTERLVGDGFKISNLASADGFLKNSRTPTPQGVLEESEGRAMVVQAGLDG